jgi:hypothetical protein
VSLVRQCHIWTGGDELDPPFGGGGAFCGCYSTFGYCRMLLLYMDEGFFLIIVKMIVIV